MPDAQTLLTVVQTTVFGIPAPRAACLAGACPKLALKTFPKKTSCTTAGSTFALFRAANGPNHAHVSAIIGAKQIHIVRSSEKKIYYLDVTFNCYRAKLRRGQGR
jgi:hypothetical protein